jgi:Ohr subfamily peroxiredoxin
MSTLYRTRVTATGGRTGRVQAQDGKLAATLSIPRELGGGGGDGTNPEQLFAAGYAACFESALRLVARRQQIALHPDTAVTAQVTLALTEAGLYQLSAALTGHLPGLTAQSAAALMKTAHQVCPYSNATRGNIRVTLTAATDDGQEVAVAA